MGKFGRLVKNEYIKLLKKVSTWIMIALIAIGAFGYAGLSLVAKISINSMDMERDNNYTEIYYQEEMDSLKKTKPAGWEQDVARYQFLLDHKIYDSQSWQYDATSTMFDLQESELPAAEIQALSTGFTKAVTDADWKLYLQTWLDAMQANQSAFTENYEDITWLNRYCLEHEIEPDEDNADYRLAEQYSAAKSGLSMLDADKAGGTVVEESEYQDAKDAVLLAEHRLNNHITFDISENSSWTQTGVFNFWTVFAGSTGLLSFIGVLMIIVAGSIVASEFSQGTIKFLLINPVKRWKILTAKYVTSITVGYGMLLLTYLLSVIITMILFGTGDMGASYLYVADGAVKSIPGFLYVLRNYLLSSVNILVMASLAFALSSLVRSAALAIGVGMFAMLGGNIVISVMSLLKLDWGRFLIFSNTDLLTIINGNAPFMGQTVGFAVGVIVVHIFTFLLIAWDGFIRREV